jgi:hypothetical protein
MALVVRQRRQLVQGAALLEGARRLHVFVLHDDVAAGELR